MDKDIVCGEIMTIRIFLQLTLKKSGKRGCNKLEEKSLMGVFEYYFSLTIFSIL